MDTTDQTKLRKPPREVIATFVRLTRELAGWKKAALASMANVSLSTVERVERGDPVSDDSLHRLAKALHQPEGAFTTPRIPSSDADAITALAEKWAWVSDVQPVSVEPLRKQAQLRALGATVVAILDHDLDDADEDVAELREWLDLLSFVRGEHEGLFSTNRPHDNRLRRLYADVLTCVTAIERRQYCVCLVGMYQPKTGLREFEGAEVGVVSLRSKRKNPAAASRRTLFAPTTVDFGAAISRAFAEDDTL